MEFLDYGSAQGGGRVGRTQVGKARNSKQNPEPKLETLNPELETEKPQNPKP